MALLKVRWNYTKSSREARYKSKGLLQTTHNIKLIFQL